MPEIAFFIKVFKVLGLVISNYSYIIKNLIIYM
jgi:hypothetical protein